MVSKSVFLKEIIMSFLKRIRRSDYGIPGYKDSSFPTSMDESFSLKRELMSDNILSPILIVVFTLAVFENIVMWVFA